MQIRFLNKSGKFKLQNYKNKLREALESCWEMLPEARENLPVDVTVELSLSFFGPRSMKKLNRDSRAMDELTDVLSFPMHQFLSGRLCEALQPGDLYPARAKTTAWLPEAEGSEPLAIYLGDIVICPDQAAEQAALYGHSLERELVFLAVHAMLHLLGFDHQNELADQEMRGLQSRVMAAIGLDLESESESDPDSKLDLDPESEQTGDAPDFRSGFIAIVGRPNAGKSTLLNQLSGEYLAITSAKAQTTRHAIRCVVNTAQAQCVFIDTPGLHKPQHKLGGFMMDAALSALKDCDVVLFLLALDKRFLTQYEVDLIKELNAAGKAVILAINKIDMMEKEALLPLIKRCTAAADFHAIVPISALKGDGHELLLDELIRCLPPGPRYYSEEEFTDQSERLIAGEIVREKILRYTNEEVPHGTAVIVNAFDEDYPETAKDEYERRQVNIQADILCEKESHKIILIGKKGSMLKRIGTAARKDIEKMLACPVRLELFVKVRPDWRNRSGILLDLDYQKKK